MDDVDDSIFVFERVLGVKYTTYRRPLASTVLSATGHPVVEKHIRASWVYLSHTLVSFPTLSLHRIPRDLTQSSYDSAPKQEAVS